MRRGRSIRSLHAAIARVAALVVAASSVLACTYPATEVRVQLDTDVPISRTMHVVVGVLDGSPATIPANLTPRHRFVRALGITDGGIESATRIPGSFAVIPGDGAPRDRAVTLVLQADVDAAGSSPAVSLRRIARFRFTPRQTTYLPLFLSILCGSPATGCTSTGEACTVSRLCEDRGTTCGERGQCVPVDVMPTSTEDAGIDAMDSRVADATIDTPATDVTTDAGPCPGGCPARSHATGTCGTDGCTYACSAGWGDCNGDPTDGCEQSLGDATACGACGRTCAAPTPVCDAMAGMCVGACATGTQCGSSCVDLQTNSANCGSCGSACAGVDVCVGGVCVCPSPLVRCGASCVDLGADRANCGSCGRACAANQMCSAGVCACNAGLATCGRSCVDLGNDSANCGACGTACASAPQVVGAHCAAGGCVVDACAAGWADCNGNSGDGCEQSLGSTTSCGACGRSCGGATPACDGATGTCVSGCGSATLCPSGCADLATDVQNCGACSRSCIGVAPHVAVASCAAGTCGVAMCSAGWGDCNAMAGDGCEQRLDVAGNCGACGANPPEACDGADNNCNGSVDEGCTRSVDVTAWTPDRACLSTYDDFRYGPDYLCTEMGYARSTGVFTCVPRTCDVDTLICDPSVDYRHNGGWGLSQYSVPGQNWCAGDMCVTQIECVIP